MTYQLVAKKLEDGNFKLAVVADNEFQDAESSTNLEVYVVEALKAIVESVKPGARLTLTVATDSEKGK